MPSITDAAAARRVASLHTAHAKFAPVVDDAQADVTALHGRGAALRQRLVEEEARRPAGPAPDVSALADALAADPEAPMDDAALDAAETANAVSTRAEQKRLARVAAITTALSKVEDQIGAAQGQVDALLEKKRDAYTVLVREAYAVMLAEFRTRFLALRDDVMLPLFALEDMRAPGGDGLLAATNNARGVLHREFLVELSTSVSMDAEPQWHGMKRETLFWGDNISRDYPAIDVDGLLGDFRAKKA